MSADYRDQAWRVTLWLNREDIDGKTAIPGALTQVAPLADQALAAELADNPHVEKSLWAQWLQGDDFCLGCASGAADTDEYWARVIARDPRARSAAHMVKEAGTQ